VSGLRQIALSMVCPHCKQTIALDKEREFQSEVEQLAYLEAEAERHLAECANRADA
jgi:glutaredoxin